MVHLFTLTTHIHPSAMGHVLGKKGKTIRSIREKFNVSTHNTPYSEHQTDYVRITINGLDRDDVQNAIFAIDDLVAISNRWCKKNGISYI